MADCEKCVFYVPRYALSEDVLEKAWAWIMENRPGATLYGWCQRYQRPVTYLRGRCRGYRSRVLPVGRPLTSYFKG